jgi:hypothetical protein
VIARGEGSCFIMGHATSPLEHISLENIKLNLVADPAAAYDKSVHALQFRYARDLTVKDLRVIWDKAESNKWQSAIYFEDVQDLTLQNFTGGPARRDSGTAAVVLDQVEGARVFDSKADLGTRVFVKVTGAQSRGIHVYNNEVTGARDAYQIDPSVRYDAVKVREDN